MTPLYKNIQRLNREQHQALRFRPLQNQAFSAGSHSVPLVGLEFFQVARHCPILFVGEEQVMPIALLGLGEGHNGFLNADYQWRANVYVPAAVRRYPFVVAQERPGEFAVCFDADYDGWNERDGQPLFTAEGGNSSFLDDMLNFLKQFAAEMARTRAFVDSLKRHSLLVSRSLELTHRNGQRFTLEGFQMVDEPRFLRLRDEQVLDLQHGGYLGWVYAHLMSVGHVDQLFDDYLARQGQRKTRG